MKLRYARVTQDEQTFAVVRVQPAVLEDRAKAEQAIQWLQSSYFHMPTVLLACNSHGVAQSYYGRGDLALVLVHTPSSAIDWQEVGVGT
jgi:hypothetical protein